MILKLKSLKSRLVKERQIWVYSGGGWLMVLANTCRMKNNSFRQFMNLRLKIAYNIWIHLKGFLKGGLSVWFHLKGVLKGGLSNSFFKGFNNFDIRGGKG